MRRTWPAAVVCLLVVHAHVAADPSPEIALLYTEAAYEALLAGELAQAERLAAVARELDEDSSDTHYVCGLVASWRRETTREAIRYAELAVRLDRWRRFTGFHGAVFLAGLYNRVGDHAAASDLLASTPGIPAVSEQTLADSYYEHLLARAALGRIAGPDDLLMAARDRFPDDPRFFRLLLEMEPYPSPDHRLEIERLLDRAAAGSANRLIEELIYDYALRATTAPEREWAREHLVRTQWSDPRLALLVDGDRAAIETFLVRDGFSDFDVYRELIRRTSDDGRDALLRAADRYNGESYRYVTRDGFWNERLTVQGGAVIRWDRDHDQDGVAELSVTFGTATPEEVVLRGDTTARLRYAQYPFLGAGEIAGNSGIERFVLRPRSVEFRVTAALPPEGPRFSSEVQLKPSVRTISRAELAAAAVTIEQVRADGTIAERMYLHEGQTRQLLRDERGDGRWDRYVRYDRGVPVAGVRDLTGDGSFEAAEGYRDGRLVALAVDTTGDGIPDVFEYDETESVREWDLNGDGLIDAREFRIWTDSVTREFPVIERLR